MLWLFYVKGNLKQEGCCLLLKTNYQMWTIYLPLLYDNNIQCKWITQSCSAYRYCVIRLKYNLIHSHSVIYPERHTYPHGSYLIQTLLCKSDIIAWDCKILYNHPRVFVVLNFKFNNYKLFQISLWKFLCIPFYWFYDNC